MVNKPNNESLADTPQKPSLNHGVRYSIPISEKVSEPEQVFSKDKIVIGGEEIEAGPSAYHDTNRPYLARLLEIPQGVVSSLSLEGDIKEVDSFILDLIKERHWKDDPKSYQDILNELQANLNIHENLDFISLLEKLTEGVKLLKLQNFHKRRDKEIQELLNKLK